MSAAHSLPTSTGRWLPFGEVGQELGVVSGSRPPRPGGRFITEDVAMIVDEMDRRDAWRASVSARHTPGMCHGIASPMSFRSPMPWRRASTSTAFRLRGRRSNVDAHENPKVCGSNQDDPGRNGAASWPMDGFEDRLAASALGGTRAGLDAAEPSVRWWAPGGYEAGRQGSRAPPVLSDRLDEVTSRHTLPNSDA